jgi:hypothetical protein
MSDPAHKQEDSPEVAALRKKIRGEPLTEAEEALLVATYRKPPEGTVTFTQEQVTSLLEERRRRGE